MKRLGVLFVVSLIFVIGVLGSSRAEGPLSLVKTVPLGSTTHDVALKDNFAYAATKLGLTVLDISNPAAPIPRGSVAINSSGGSQGVEVAGQYAYVASRDAGLKIVDVSNPDAPRVVGSAKVSGQAWDVAIKDNVAYVASYGKGQIQLFDVSNPASPRLIRSIGIFKWTNPGADEVYLEKLNSYATAGNALVTGVSVTGNILVSVDWGLGRLTYHDVTNAANPVFRGTHQAPFLLKALADPDRDVVYMLSAYGGTSGIYTVPISIMAPDRSTYHAECSQCDYLSSNGGMGQGGLALSSSGNHLLYDGGGKTVLHVVDSSDPTFLKELVSVRIGRTGVGLAEHMGLAIRGDYIFLAAGAFGVQVYLYPPLSD